VRIVDPTHRSKGGLSMNLRSRDGVNRLRRQ
jgi:hypothetical protein